MKKVTLIMLALTFMLATVLFTACGNDKIPPELDNSTTASASESEHKNSRLPTGTSVPEVSDSVEETSTNENSTSEPTSVVISGSGYVVNSTDPSNASINAANVIKFINLIGEINSENYDRKISVITEAENQYAALTSTEKQEVTNYSDLQKARETYDALKTSANIEIFKIDYAKLPADVSTLIKDDAKLVTTLRSIFANLNETDKAKLGNVSEISQKLDAAFNALKSSGGLSHILIADKPTDNDGFFTLSANITTEESEKPMAYNSETLTNSFCLDGSESNITTISFTTEITGNLTIYACKESGKIKLYNGNITVDKTSTSISEGTINDLGDDCYTQTFTLEANKAYQLANYESQVFVLAILFEVA